MSNATMTEQGLHLGVAVLVTHEDHGHTMSQQQGGCQVAHLPGAQPQNSAVPGWPLRAAVPGQIVALAIPGMQ